MFHLKVFNFVWIVNITIIILVAFHFLLRPTSFNKSLKTIPLTTKECSAGLLFSFYGWE